MRNLLPLAVLCCLSAMLHAADPIYGGGSAVINGTPESAFTQGKDFAGTMQAEVQKSFSEAKAKESLDFTADPVEASYYGKTPPRDKGDEKMSYCSSVDLSGLTEQQRKECEAVNYLSDMQNRSNPYTFDEGTDPLFKRYEEGIDLSKKISADTCNLEGSPIVGAGGYTEICTEGIQREDKTCQDILDVNVSKDMRTYQLEFAVTILLSKSSSNGCEEDYGEGSFTIDFGKLSTYFTGSELSSGYYWKPDHYVGLHAGARMGYGATYINSRLNQSVTAISTSLADNGKVCHRSPNMVSGIYLRPIYNTDMVDFLYKIDGKPKLSYTTSFKDVDQVRVISVSNAPGASSSGPNCNLGTDVPRLYYDMSGSTYYNGPGRCNTNPSKSATVLNEQAGIVKLTVAKGSPPFSYHYIHNFSRSYIGLGYPVRLKLAVTRSQTTITDNWVNGCASLSE